MVAHIINLITLLFLYSCFAEQKVSLHVVPNDSASPDDQSSEGQPVINEKPEAAKYYLSPTGDDTNAGTITAPMKTLQKLWTVLEPGDLVYLRGGEYKFDVQQYLRGVNGTAEKRIRIFAYPGETPILTRSAAWYKPGNQWHRGGIFFSGDYFHFKGLEITGYEQTDNQVESGFLAYDANHNIFERLNVHHNGHGFYLENDSTGNLFLNSDFHHNRDGYTNGGNSDGLSLAYVSEGTENTIRGCRAWWNTDDGFDFFENRGVVTIENSWAWNNGYLPDTMTPSGNGVGIKLGSVFLAGATYSSTVLRYVRNNLVFNNRDYGIHINEGDMRTVIDHNIMFNNVVGGLNFHYLNRVHTFRNNISLQNGNTQVEISSNSLSTKNAVGIGHNDGGWSIPASSSDFKSISSVGVDGARGPDGSLPRLDFLRLKSTSALIDAGVDVGLSFKGPAPDLGAFEIE